MKNSISTLIFTLLFAFLFNHAFASTESIDSKAAPDEIIFYSNGSEFSPVIVLEGDAQVLWTWDDNTTSNSATPSKNYGSEGLRKNVLKVTPWSAVRRINIGYDAADSGSPEIELVNNQFVSTIENLNNVAPYLREWCSSYNMLTSLDFSNFVNLETIECYSSETLQNVNLTNTPKLKRVCFVKNGLTSLDLSNNTALEQALASYNVLTNLSLPTQANDLWSLVVLDNPQLTNQNLINDLTNYPNIANLAIWKSNQSGSLVIPKTSSTRWVGVRAADNNYTSIDFRGAFQNSLQAGQVDMKNNKLTRVDIAGCHQIKSLNLSQNLISSDEVERILKQLDEFGPTITTRDVDLSKNEPIVSEQARTYKTNLEAKGWTVLVEFPTSNDELSQANQLKVYPNPSKGRFNIQLANMPADGVMVEIKNVIGQKLFEQKVYDNNSEWSVEQYKGKIFFVTINGTNINETKKLIIE